MRNLYVAVTSIVIILALVGISRATSVDYAEYLDVFYTLENPSNPTVENGKVLWGSPWTEFTLPNSFMLRPDDSVYLGLSNEYVNNVLKTVTLTYTSDVRLDIAETLSGDNPLGPWNGATQSPEQSSGIVVYTITGTIGPPQPWWEWIKLTNSSGVHASFTVNEYTSVCPEPSTFVLLVVGAISLLTYGWRRRK